MAWVRVPGWGQGQLGQGGHRECAPLSLEEGDARVVVGGLVDECREQRTPQGSMSSPLSIWKVGAPGCSSSKSWPWEESHGPELLGPTSAPVGASPAGAAQEMPLTVSPITPSFLN